MDEHNQFRAIALSADLVKRTQATVMALAKTIEAMDSEAGLDRLIEEIKQSPRPIENPRYISAAIIGCMEYWIASGYFTRAQLVEAAGTVANSIKPLPEGPSRSMN